MVEKNQKRKEDSCPLKEIFSDACATCSSEWCKSDIIEEEMDNVLTPIKQEK
jgi:hypothetical protein